jgi:hypothetical protein
VTAGQRPLPWEVPLSKPLPEAIECIACGRNERQLIEAGTQMIRKSEVFGVGICMACAMDSECGFWQEFLEVP